MAASAKNKKQERKKSKQGAAKGEKAARGAKAEKGRGKKVRPVPKGSEGVIAHLVVSDGKAAIAFYRKAFGALVREKHAAPGDGRLMHAELEIDGRLLYLGDEFPEFGGPSRTPQALGGTAVILHRYVEDCDKAIAKAVKAGATLTMPAMDMFWGDRYGRVLDPFGYEWALATRVREVAARDMKAAMKAILSGCEQEAPAESTAITATEEPASAGL
jgi:uncharacterized glyoxalase superfamily protein PhnB